jgi:hypothetical protein
MMKTQILTEFYLSRELSEFLAKMKPENLREDIKQELFLALCEKSDEDIIALHQKKQLKFFAVRIVLNMVQSKKSRFYYKYRKNPTIEFKGYESSDFLIDKGIEAAEGLTSAEQFEKEHEQLLARVNTAIDDLGWYAGEVLREYVRHGSAGKMSRDMEDRIGKGLSIAPRSIQDTVKKATTEIRKKIRK